MARPVSGKHEQARMRQQRYRERLRARKVPEVSDLDTALAISIAGLVNELETMMKTPAGDEDCMPGSPTLSKDRLERVVLGAVDHLRSAGYNGKVSGKLMYRRLTWLREGLKDPKADWVTKRGLYDQR